MKQSPLHERHVKLNAQFAETAGWTMPQHYGDPAVEYRAVREAVAVADLSHRGMLRVTGDDRVTWLQSIISNDLRPLQPGSGTYSSFLSHKGKMLTYFRVYLLPDAVMLEDVGEIGETTQQTLRKFLLYGTKAKMESCAGTWGLLLVSGPKTPELIRTALQVEVAGLKPLTFATCDVGGQQALCIRTEETGEIDIEILVPAAGVEAAWAALWKAGEPLGLKPFGTAAREVLRVEAGLPLAGRDITEDIVPPEANLEGRAFSLSKGCYPGQEVVARMDTYGNVRRRLVGLVLEGEGLPERGARIYSGEREVGWVSSATRSPALGKSIAMGFPLRDFSKPDTELTVEVEGQRRKATVQALPFVKQTGDGRRKAGGEQT